MLKTILVVDDEPRTRLGIQKMLIGWSAGKHRIESVSSGIEALEWLAEHVAHVIITDVRMPEIDGLQMLETLATQRQLPIVIVISGYAEFEYAKRSLQLGVFEYLLKPLDKSILIQTVQKAIELCDIRERYDVLKKLADPRLLEAGSDGEKYGSAIREAVDYINGHLHEPISLTQIAEVVHLNASYFSVLFKEQTGLTFSEYLTSARMLRAKELLVTTRMPVWEIAENVGYQTTRYFIKVFKDSEGLSPSQYRQQMMIDGETSQS